MVYRLIKDLGGLKKGTELRFVKGVFVHRDASFDPMDVFLDTDHFEEVGESVGVCNLAFQTI